MGRSQSKVKVPTNPIQRLELQQKRKQKELERRQKRQKQLEKHFEKMEKNFQVNTNSKNKSENNFNDSFECKEIIVKKLNEQINSDFCSFLLNQMMLSLVIFENYERDLAEAKENGRQYECDINKNLEQYSIILPNVLDKAVDKGLKFRNKHGFHKNQDIPLQVQRMFVVYENIEIMSTEDSTYSSISPLFKAILDFDKYCEGNWKGYIRLSISSNNKSIEEMKLNQEKIVESGNEADHNSNTSSDEYTDMKNAHELNKNNLTDSWASLTNPSSSDYDYAYIRAVNKHQPLGQLTTIKSKETQSMNEFLPIVYKTNDLEDFSFEIEKLSNKFINSKAFLCYFVSQLENQLGSKLKISKDDLQNATWKEASIFVNEFEIIPAIFCPWPECAREWQLRERSAYINPKTGNKFQWPSKNMIQKIISFGCHVIPTGYIPKRGRNPYHNLEWKIIFPKAERYLEFYLTHAQVKILVVTKSLVKTFIEHKSHFLYTMDLIKTHLFWEYERNYLIWSEENCGEVLVRFLKSFLNRISTKYLPDYFLPQRNLLENIPETELAELHQRFSNILDNPVMHLMAAYRNLHNLDMFCPKLEYKQIFNALTVRNPLFLFRNFSEKQDQLQLHTKAKQMYSGISETETNDNFLDRNLRRTKRLKRKNREIIRIHREKENYRRSSFDSIDFTFLVPKNIERLSQQEENVEHRKVLDDLRKTILVEIFTTHFMAIAKYLKQKNTNILCQIYLNHITKILSLIKELGDNSKLNNLKEDLQKLYTELESNENNKQGPNLPQRKLEKSLNTIETVHENNTDSEKIFIEPRKFTSIILNKNEIFSNTEFIKNDGLNVRFKIKPKNETESSQS